MEQQAVIVRFVEFGQRFWQDGTSSLQPLYDLEDQLTETIDAAGVGELDGHEIALDGSDGFLFMYGPDARKLFAAIEPVLRSSPVTEGCTVEFRFGATSDEVVHEEPKAPQ